MAKIKRTRRSPEAILLRAGQYQPHRVKPKKGKGTYSRKEKHEQYQ